MTQRSIVTATAGVLLIALLVGCGDDTGGGFNASDEPTATPSVAETETAAPTATETQTATPTVTATETATPSPSPTMTPTTASSEQLSSPTTTEPPTTYAASGTCDRDAASEVIERYISAFNSGDLEQLAAFFPEEWYDWFGSNPRVNPEEDDILLGYWMNSSDGSFGGATNKDDLLAYLGERIAQSERLELVSLRVTPSGNVGYIDAEFIRFASDIETHAIHGKAQVNCEQQLITMWVMVDSS